MNRGQMAACFISLAAFCHRAEAATITVTTTDDSGVGSLRAAISNANATVVQDSISFNISGTGPFTITPATALPTITNSVVIDGYTQPGASQNTLTNGDNAVIEIVLTGTFGFLSLDTSNSTVRGLSINTITTSAAPSPKGGHIIQGNFIGVDPSGTNSLGATGGGVGVNCPNLQIGGTTPASRNLISGHGTTGIEMAGDFAKGTVIQGNYIGTDKTGTKSIPNTDRAVVCNSFSQNNTIGGTTIGARNIISGNNNRGVILDGTNNVAQGNYIGVDVTGINPLGNGNSGVEIVGSNNVCGGTAGGAGNVIAYNGISGTPFTNGVDVQPGVKVYAILSNSIFDNAGLGIDVNRDGITPGAPVITVATNGPGGTAIKGTYTPSTTSRIEFFSNPTRDPSGFGEGKTVVLSSNVTADAGGNFTVTLPTTVLPGLFISATGGGTTEFSQCQMVIVPGSTNSWTNSVSGAWENGTNWSLAAPPYIGFSANLITNANSKTVTISSNTAANFPNTMSISNLTVGAPGGATNTLVVVNVGPSVPLHIYRGCIITNGGAVTLTNSVLQVDGLSNSFFRIDGSLAFNGGALIASNATLFNTVIGNVGQGSLSLSNATAAFTYPIVGANAGSQGILTLAGGTATVSSVMDLGDDLTATGTVWIIDSQLNVPGLYVGLFGTGQFTASNSTVRSSGGLDVGSQAGARGTYTSVNTTNTFTGIIIGESGAGTGSVVLIGGQLTETNSPINVGLSGVGLLSVSNTTMLTSGIILGKNSGSVGQFTFAGGSMVLSNLTTTGTVAGVTRTILVTGGQLVLTNTPTTISTDSLSRVTLSNGTLQVSALTVIPSATAGSLTVAGGNLNVGGDLNCIGPGTALWLTGGQVTVTNGNAFAGQIAISNGTFMAHDLFIGNSGFGTVTVAGGALVMTSGGNGLVIGNGSATGTVWLTGGNLVANNATISVGGLFSPAVGNLIISNGSVQAANMLLASQSSGRGSVVIAGGTHSVYANMILGDSSCVGTGTVTMTGGQLYITNAAGNATLDIEGGTFILMGGVLHMNKIQMVNPCTHFINMGGTVTYDSYVLLSNRDDDGDGIPNSYELSHGLNALDPINATKDTDGDGQSDLEEYLAGTDATDPTSVFRITSVVRTNNNMRITWFTAGGHTNRVYYSTGDTDGSYNDVFANLSSFIIIPGTGPVTTNYTDVGGATNVPARYYRVRLIQ